MRVGILTPTQTDSDRPFIWTSVKEARRYLAAGSHIQVYTGKLLKIRELVTRVTVSIVERAHSQRAWGDRVKFVPQLNEPGPDGNLDLSYPAPMQASVHHKHPGMLAACLAAKQREQQPENQ